MAQAQLDFGGRTQLYYQLYDILYKDIREGVYQPGELLPTENELIERYKISRVTVRKAMDLLSNDGLIIRRRGYGTYVQKKKVGTQLFRAMHFATSMIEQGFTPRIEMERNKKISASKSVAEALRIPEGTPVINLRRIRYADDLPLWFESTHLVYEKYPLIEQGDFSEHSLRQFLLEHYNVKWETLQQKIYAIAVDAKHAKFLGVAQGDPVLYSEYIFYKSNGEPGEYVRVYYRADSNYFSTSYALED